MCSYSRLVGKQSKAQTVLNHLMNLSTELWTSERLCFPCPPVLLTVIIGVDYNDFVLMFKM